MANLRLFIALNLPATVRERLGAVQQNLQGTTGTRIKWVETENMHLTLEFLGEVPDTRVDLLKKILQQAAAGCPEINLSLKEIGAFPHWRNPRAIWAGLGGDTLLLGQLQGRLHQALLKQDFHLESKPYQPHLTLGRVKQRPPKALAAKANLDLEKTAAQQTGLLKSTTLTLNRVELMHSLLTRNGPVYTVLFRTFLSAKKEVDNG